MVGLDLAIVYICLHSPLNVLFLAADQHPYKCCLVKKFAKFFMQLTLRQLRKYFRLMVLLLSQLFSSSKHFLSGPDNFSAFFKTNIETYYPSINFYILNFVSVSFLFRT
jgi:hypothetical protein